MTATNHDIQDLVNVKISLNEKYSYYDSNGESGHNVLPFFKHHIIVSELAERIRHSNGTALLITGLRGVGKTTIVKRSIHRLELNGIRCLPIYINLSRELPFQTLLFEIIRRLYEAVGDRGLLERSSERAIDELRLAYYRTSLSIKGSVSSGNETNIGFKSNFAGSELEAKGSVSKQLSSESTFLAYTENDAEHDLLRIVDLLDEEHSTKYKTVLILDEIDKLTAREGGIKYFEEMLGRLKNIICSIRAVSVFVGGIDLYQKWGYDVTKIDSLYDSIFSWHLYVPCIWDSIDSLLDLFEDKHYAYKEIDSDLRYLCKCDLTSCIKQSFSVFLDYINYKSKGLPRKIYSEFSKYVYWNHNKASFMLTKSNVKTILSFNETWNKISPIFRRQVFPSQMIMDMTYVICFSMIDYFLKFTAVKFTIQDINEALLYHENVGTDENIQLKRIIKVLLKCFTDAHVIRQLENDSYIVTDIAIKEDDLVSLGVALPLDYLKDGSGNDDNSDSKEDLNSLYQACIDKYNSEKVSKFWAPFSAVELVSQNVAQTTFLVRNFTTKVDYLGIFYTGEENPRLNKTCNLYQLMNYSISSKHLCNVTDIVDDKRVRTSLREIVHGCILSDIICAQIHRKYVMGITEQLLHFCDNLHAQGYCNAKISAENIMVCPDLKIKILDIRSAVKIGTTGDMLAHHISSAPELIRGSANAGSDLFAVGVVLWEMLAAKKSTGRTTAQPIDYRLLEKPAGCSKRLWKVIEKATQPDVEERYLSAHAFLSDLENCWEYRQGCFADWQSAKDGVATNHYSDTVLSAYKTPIFVANKNNQGETCILGAEDSGTIPVQPNVPARAFILRKGTHELIPVDKEIFTIGRDESADLCLNNRLISRKQAIIKKENGMYYLKVLNARNPIMLNGQPILGNTALLHHEDTIVCFDETLLFYISYREDDNTKTDWMRSQTSDTTVF